MILKNITFIISAMLPVLIGVGCQTPGLQITSVPDGATVMRVNADGSTTDLGKTPLRLNTDEAIKGVETFGHLIVAQNDFSRESLIIPKSMFSARHEITVRLREKSQKPWENSGSGDDCRADGAGIAVLARGVAEVQALLVKRELVVAEQRLTALITQFSYVSVLYDLLGNVHYLNRNLDAAIKSYQRSLELDPQNIETERMVQRLQTLRSTSADRAGG